MKTLEFKLTVTRHQQTKIDTWLDSLRWVWNRGLRLLEESQQRRWREKHGRSLPIGLKLQWRRGKITGGGIRKSRDGYKYCPIRQDSDIDDPKKLFVSGSYYNNSNAPHLVDVPSKYRTGVHKAFRALNDVAWGDLRAKIETKCKSHGREFVATTAQNSSITCSVCSHIDKANRQTQKYFRCIRTGHIDNADANAAKNHLLNSGFLTTGRYRSLEWELKQGTKMVSSPSGDTPLNDEKPSHNGTPPEGIDSYHPIVNYRSLCLTRQSKDSSESMPPCRELSAAISTSRSSILTKKRRTGGVRKNDSSKTAETSSQQLLQPCLFDIDCVGSSEKLTTKRIGPDRKRRKKNETGVSKHRTSSQSDSVSETYSQNELWEEALEIDPNES